VANLLVEQLIRDPVLILLDNVGQQLFSLGQAVMRGLRPRPLRCPGLRLLFILLRTGCAEIRQVLLLVHRNNIPK
jgi:hypothetical protein